MKNACSMVLLSYVHITNVDKTLFVMYSRSMLYRYMYIHKMVSLEYLSLDNWIILAFMQCYVSSLVSSIVWFAIGRIKTMNKVGHRQDF